MGPGCSGPVAVSYVWSTPRSWYQVSGSAREVPEAITRMDGPMATRAFSSLVVGPCVGSGRPARCSVGRADRDSAEHEAHLLPWPVAPVPLISPSLAVMTPGRIGPPRRGCRRSVRRHAGVTGYRPPPGRITVHPLIIANRPHVADAVCVASVK